MIPSDITMSEEKEREDAMQDLMTRVMETLILEDELAFDKSDEKYAQMAFEDLIEITKESPHLMLPHINELFQFVYQILGKSEFERKTRFLAQELMGLLVMHYRDEEPVLIQTGIFISGIVSMLENIDDDPSWDGNDNFEDDSRVFVEGVEKLARFAPAIGGQFILEKYSLLFEWHFFSEEWQNRHAAVVSHSIIARNCPKESINKLDLLVERPIEAINDTHYRVCWAAINAIEVFSKNLNPEFQFQYYEKVLPALTKALNFSSHPSIQVQAASTLFHFGKYCTSDLLTPYMDEIVSKLLRCLQRGKQQLKEEALTAIASLALSLEFFQDLFQPHYKTVMPHLKVIMMKAATGSNGMLLLKSIECITTVGLAAGKKDFSDDIPMAWGRLCKCLGQEFQPYLCVIVPRSIQSAQLQCHVTSPQYSESKKSLQSLGDERTDIKGEVLKEKAKGCKLLCTSATELVEHFHLWIDEVAQTLVPLINFDLHEEVRKVSVMAMPKILRSSKAAIEKGYVQGYQELPFENLCSYIISALTEALDKEQLMEIQLTTLESLEECMEMSEPTLKKEQIKRFLYIILKILISSSTTSRSGVENEQIEKIHSKAGDCLITFTEIYKASLSQFFDQILSCMPYMWENDRKPKERRTAFRIFSDVVEKCQEEALKYCEGSLRFLIDACYEMNPEIQKIVAQCIGVSASFGGAIFKSHMKEALGGLNSIMQNPETLHPDYLPAHAAAVSALGKICLYHHEELNEEFGIWISHLPIMNDLYQARVVHNQLCLMVNKFSEELIHNENTHLSKIISVFAEILWAGDTLASTETVNRVIEQLKHLQRNLPPNTWVSILSSLVHSRAKLLQLKLSA
ncbi:importin-5-like isoform X3 [Manihot esculenta]|uniref:Uncharacterized protein n=1 Tax=Manihot esculenta TaxID=3983 RepID=A0ACB7GMF3_MANES|nr:importin-5-like isoform X3 [Manihot esculenta]KAG8640919.1 hypothetical protein MANES_13G089875v8 [Manihot esculenta]